MTRERQGVVFTQPPASAGSTEWLEIQRRNNHHIKGEPDA